MNEQLVEVAAQVGTSVSEGLAAGANAIVESDLFHSLLGTLTSQVANDLLQFISKTQS